MPFPNHIKERLDHSTNSNDELPAIFQIIVECHDEDEQRALYERLAEEGFECRVVTV